MLHLKCLAGSIFSLTCVQNGSPLWMNFYFRQFFVSCDVITQKSRESAIDDARVAGVTFSLCSSHDNSTVFREKLSVLTAELTRPSLRNLRETLQLIWSSGCNFASKSRVRSLPWNSRQFSKPAAVWCIYPAACTAIADTDEKKNMSSKFSGEVKWPASEIPGIC